MDEDGQSGSICEPCVPKEYYNMDDICNLETYSLRGAQACSYKCFDQPLPASALAEANQNEQDDSELLNATSLLIFFTLYLVIM